MSCSSPPSRPRWPTSVDVLISAISSSDEQAQLDADAHRDRRRGRRGVPRRRRAPARGRRGAPRAAAARAPQPEHAPARAPGAGQPLVRRGRRALVEDQVARQAVQRLRPRAAVHLALGRDGAALRARLRPEPVHRPRLRCGDAGARRRGAADAADADDGGVGRRQLRGGLPQEHERGDDGGEGGVALAAGLLRSRSLPPRASSARAARSSSARRAARRRRRPAGLATASVRKAAPAPAADAPRRAWRRRRAGAGAGGGRGAEAARPADVGGGAEGVRPLRRGGEAALRRALDAVRAPAPPDRVRPGELARHLRRLGRGEGGERAGADAAAPRRPRGRRAAPRRWRTSRKAAAARATSPATALLLALLLGAAPPPLAEMELFSQATPTPSESGRRAAPARRRRRRSVGRARRRGREQRWFWLNLELYHRGAAPFHAAATALRVSVESRASPGDPWHPYRLGVGDARAHVRRRRVVRPLPLIAVSGLHARYWRVGVELLETGSQMRRAPPPTSTTTAPAPRRPRRRRARRGV